MRCGSVVARIKIEPPPRPDNGHHAYGLFFSREIRGECINRRPAGAITECGHDKDTCDGYISQVTSKHVRCHFGLEVHACGLCQTDIPCESRIPSENDLQEHGPRLRRLSDGSLGRRKTLLLSYRKLCCLRLELSSYTFSTVSQNIDQRPQFFLDFHDLFC